MVRRYGFYRRLSWIGEYSNYKDPTITSDRIKVEGVVYPKLALRGLDRLDVHGQISGSVSLRKSWVK